MPRSDRGLSRLLEPAELAALRRALAGLLPDAGVRLIEDERDVNGRPSRAILADGQAVGWLTVHGDVPAAALEAAASAAELVVAGAAARRAVSIEALQRYRELNLLYRTGTALGTLVEPDAIVREVIDEACRVLRPDAIAVLGPNGEVRQAVASDAALVDRLAMVGGPLVKSVRARACADIEATDDGLFGSLLAVPIRGADGPSGNGPTGGDSILLGRLAGTGEFSAGDESLVVALADQAASALDRVRSHRREAERQRLDDELSLGRRIQVGLLPHRLPDVAGWQLAAAYEPAREVGGDLYDVLASPDDDRIALLVADVTGKGVPAALMMASVRSTIRGLAAGGEASPGAILEQANRLMRLDGRPALLVTAFLAWLEPSSGELTYASAGHDPPILVRRDGTVERLESAGVILGFANSPNIPVGTARLRPDDVLALYTDGITEARDASGALFGEDRTAEILAANRGGSAADVVSALTDAVRAFAGDTPAWDDQTLLIVKRLGSDASTP